MMLPEYAVDKDGWWYKWNSQFYKYVALKKEYWPSVSGKGDHILQQTNGDADAK